ncbi:F-box protein At3g62230-like [Hevea brasiliensis]|uniref:F-box protein At3g62230-like n=1 Tax=Hevea brasiliensis TaxID=3981 RepID=UPI0025EFEA2C|nr:F-box protein At3g62230-like [Hevea brasiliensis]
MQNFVTFAISRNVKELEIDFSDPTWREDNLDNHPAVAELPLQAYHHVGLESLKSLLVNCPLLESLSLKNCWNVIEHFEISLPNLKLKNLVLDKCNFIHDMFWIDGPKLKFLKYSGKIDYFHLLDQRDMTEADLDFGMKLEFEEVGALLYDFLQELCSVRVLTVCSVFLQIVAQGEEPLRVHAPIDVRHLILKTLMHLNEFHGMRFMFSSCPLLEILTLDIGHRKIFHNYVPPFELNPHEFWSKDIRVQKCIHSCLRVVNVKGFKGTLNELYVLRYIICYGRQLQHLNLHISNEEGDNGENRDTYMTRVERITQFKNSSPNLQISIF